MEAAHVAFRPLVLESVRCLECGEVYAKPSAGGTVQKNPGCPSCGYVGWIPVTVPLERLHRSAADLPRVRRVRSH
jgi:predicted  nucleic acid-binding Zn-ribbon protein